MQPLPCPKCQHKPNPQDPRHRQGICPACGVVYHKYRPPESRQLWTQEPPEPLWRRLKDSFVYVPEAVDPIYFGGRVVTLLGLCLWTLYFVSGGVDWQRIGSSFMHNINLPFHEFGHVFFRPFGEFMTILGGSLFQVALPLVLMLAFVFYRHDTFAGSVMLWWCGQNFVDVAPYIADAEARSLPLILGMGEEAHDWGNLLTELDALPLANSLAQQSFTLGALLMLGALLWGAYVLYLQKQVLADNTQY
jgi:hypothetical protein